MKQKIIPILSVLVGIAAFILTSQYLRAQRRELERERARIYEGAKKIYVVAAAEDIPGGTKIRESNIGKISIFASSAPDRIILPSEAHMIIGKTALVEIKAGKPILWSDIEGGSPADQGLAPMVQPTMRAISISVSGSASVSGMVRPNDRVDVLGTFTLPSRTTPGEMETETLTLLQDVTVLATGQEVSRYGGDIQRRQSYSTVTLLVTPQEAELLAFAEQMKGRLMLTLRNPADDSFEETLPEVNFRYIVENLPKLYQFRQENIRHRSLRRPSVP